MIASGLEATLVLLVELVRYGSTDQLLRSVVATLSEGRRGSARPQKLQETVLQNTSNFPLLNLIQKQTTTSDSAQILMLASDWARMRRHRASFGA